MAGEFSGNFPGSDAGDECMGLLKNLGREEILEILFGGEGICKDCQSLLKARIHNHINASNGDSKSSTKFLSANSSDSFSSDQSQTSTKSSTSWSSTQTPESVYSGTRRGFANSSPASVNSKQPLVQRQAFEISLNDGLGGVPSVADNGLSEEQKERIRFGQIRRKKDFVHVERIDGKATNVLKGLELHTQVFNAEEQKKIVGCVYALQRKGQQGQLRARTYSEPRKWMRGKGRVTIQFGCCYNYAVDKNGNPPGIIRDEDVDPLPPLFVAMIKRMVRWHVLPPTCIPNSCIVNLYDEGDCIPPHIDHHDFLRPFCTVSFLTECNILFGANLKIAGPGEFAGPVSIPLPVGSVLILNGNGANVAKHCVPGVPAKRISITFRKMDESKLPYNYSPIPELVGIKPLAYSSSPVTKLPAQQNQQGNGEITPRESAKARDNSEASNGNNSLLSEADAFPPLGSSNSGSRQRRSNRNGRW